ncbi:hypothetical protein HPB48_022032 [Haemaphysalis longicornis]|uniref:Uncharacterized protein n=1 Tax=Haemaphysalis longicornis TaxID=44386 RepID=A0A9J6FNM9_HAELO|nr:hypothetical protein HPB48_022032 [Haemaphysalis longicornis]
MIDESLGSGNHLEAALPQQSDYGQKPEVPPFATMRDRGLFFVKSHKDALAVITDFMGNCFLIEDNHINVSTPSFSGTISTFFYRRLGLRELDVLLGSRMMTPLQMSAVALACPRTGSWQPFNIRVTSPSSCKKAGSELTPHYHVLFPPRGTNCSMPTHSRRKLRTAY